jgi:subtilisin family serine protease
VDDYVVPNAFTLEASPFVGDQDTLSPEDMTDYGGHGTMVASVAGGMKQGVAPQANLVIIKFRNAAAQAGIGRNRLRGVTSAALRVAWDYAINDAITRRNGGDTGKFIINMSYGNGTSQGSLRFCLADAKYRVPSNGSSPFASRVHNGQSNSLRCGERHRSYHTYR